MEEVPFVWPRLPRLTNRLPVFTDPEKEMDEVREEVIRALVKLSAWTTEMAHIITKKPMSKELKVKAMELFTSWLKYWAFQAPYINEYKIVELDPLPTTPSDELTEDGYRRIRESLASYVISEISRLYFLLSFDNFEDQQWKLADTTQDWWIEDWSELVTCPQSLDDPSEAMLKLRKDNEAQRRKEELEGPKNKKLKESEPLPDDIFIQAFEAFGIPLEQGEEENPEETTIPKSKEKLWFRPISAYTQRNLYDAVMLLTERINDYVYHLDITTLIMRLTARLGAFFLQPETDLVFDIPRYRDKFDDTLYRCNRAFMHWAAAYFYELLQRVLYAQCIMKDNAIPQDLKPFDDYTEDKVIALKEYIVFLCRDMGRDDFFYLYGESLKENFEFPGDDVFYKHVHPDGYIDRGDLLLELRSERQAPRFFSNQRMSVPTILNMMMRGDTHLARVIILNVLDRFFSMECDINWRNAIVVDQGGIQLSENKLKDSSVPCIVSVFSVPLLHVRLIDEDENPRRLIHETGNIYETIVMWLLFIRHDKGGFLFRKDISNQIRQLLGEDDNNRKRVRSVMKQAEDPEDDYEEIEQLIYDNNNNVIAPL